MIAIAKIGGHQALVTTGDILEIDKLDVEVGKTTSFPVLLVSEEDGKDFQIGTPLIDGVSVEAKVLEHGRGKKITVFKMKPRKRYRRTRGHRQDFTVVEVTKIGSASKSAPKKTEEKKDDEKKEVKKETSKKAAPKKVEKSTKKS